MPDLQLRRAKVGDQSPESNRATGEERALQIAGDVSYEKSPCVLVVDDDPLNVEMLSAYLEDEGYQVTTAYTGVEALESVIASPPDLIFLDAMMPGMDGFEVCPRLKAMPDT